MTTDYRPIDCDQHSALELLAMRRVSVTARATDEGGAALTLQGVVSDVLTRRGEEFLVLRDPAGRERSIRLDRLQALYGAAGGLLWQHGRSGAGDA